MSEHKVLNLYGEQIDYFEKAKERMETRTGEEFTHGQIIRVVCACYLEDSQGVPNILKDLHPEHASENGDPVFSLAELNEFHDMDPNILRRFASRTGTDSIKGKSYNEYELKSYFARGATPDSDESDDPTPNAAVVGHKSPQGD